MPVAVFCSCTLPSLPLRQHSVFLSCCVPSSELSVSCLPAGFHLGPAVPVACTLIVLICTLTAPIISSHHPCHLHLHCPCHPHPPLPLPLHHLTCVLLRPHTI